MNKLNNMKVCWWLILSVALFFCQVTTVLGVTATPFSVSLGFDFASGDYGTSEDTESIRIPLTLGYAPNDWLDFELGACPTIHDRLQTQLFGPYLSSFSTNSYGYYSQTS